MILRPDICANCKHHFKPSGNLPFIECRLNPPTTQVFIGPGPNGGPPRELGHSSYFVRVAPDWQCDQWKPGVAQAETKDNYVSRKIGVSLA